MADDSSASAGAPPRKLLSWEKAWSGEHRIQASDAERAALDKLRALAEEQHSDNAYLHEWMTDERVPLRFLRGHNLNPKVALKHLSDAATWRAGYGTDAVLEDWEKELASDAEEHGKTRLIHEHWGMGIVGRLDDGTLVQVNRFGRVDYPNLVEAVGMETMIRRSVYQLEK